MQLTRTAVPVVPAAGPAQQGRWRGARWTLALPVQEIAGDQRAINHQIPRQNGQQRQRQQVHPMRIGDAVRQRAQRTRPQKGGPGQPRCPGAGLLQRRQRRMAVFSDAQHLRCALLQKGLDIGVSQRGHAVVGWQAFSDRLQRKPVHFFALDRAEQLALQVAGFNRLREHQAACRGFVNRDAFGGLVHESDDAEFALTRAGLANALQHVCGSCTLESRQ